LSYNYQHSYFRQIYMWGVEIMAFRKVKANNKKGYKWECIKDAPPDPATGARRQITRRAERKDDAEALVDEALRKLTEHGIDEKKIKNLLFEKVAQEWLDIYSRGKVKASTVLKRKRTITLILKYYGKANIDNITPRMHQIMLNDLDDKDYSKSTIKLVHDTASLIFRFAIKNKIRLGNPCEGATIPVRKLTVEDIENNSIEEKYLEKDELFEFLKVAKENGLKYDFERFYLLAFSGIRSGELCSLKWSDIDFDTNEIRITKTLFNPDGDMKKYQLTPPKTDGSIRTIEIDDDIMKILKSHKAKQAEDKLANRHLHKDYHEGNFVFCHDNGYPFIQINIIWRMKRLLKMTSITKHATPHIFRHTHISMLAEANVDLFTIMKRVGHDDEKTTKSIYMHVTKKMKKNASEKIKSTFGNILKLIN
jgi:integrase